MGNKISCANCNGKPASSATGSAHHHHHHYHQQSTMGGSGGPMNVSIASGSGRSTNYAHHSQVLSGSCGGPMTNILSGRSNHILRLWAEVFHVSASSGAVRWTQVSDDLVPITVNYLNGRYHITAFNSRVEKVLDCWLQSSKLGQASSCFIYWKDNVSGDTWGLNFTSPTDARAFRECLQSGTIQLKTSSGSGSGGHTLPKRAESSYSLRGGEHSERVQQPSKAGSGAHLTTKYYSNRGAMSTPNSPSRRRLQQHYQQQQQQQQQQLLHHQQQQQHHQSHQNMNDQYAQQPQCTCDCLTAEMLHKQRNGRIRYANFTRQDSGGTTQSSRSDGSLVRRQHERQQQYQRSVQQRSIEDQSKKRVSGVAGTTARIIGPGHRRPVASNLQQAQQASRIAQQSAGGDQQSCPPSAQNGSYIQIQHQKAIVHATSKDVQDLPGPDYHHQQQQQQPPSRPQSQAQASQTQQLVSIATTTDDLDQKQASQSQQQQQQQQQQQLQQQHSISRRYSQRPKSLLSDQEKCRDRTHRSLEGRRRSLERMQCVDLTDISPTILNRLDSKDISLEKSSASQLEEYERELRRKLLHGDGDSGQNDAMETFETLLKESMDDVANLMREVQHELTLIRAEEKRYQSQSTQSLHRISSNSFGGGTRSPVFDTMSIDGQLPFLPSFATSLAKASSAYQNAYQSWDRLGGYLTSSEVSDDERASLTTAISDDEDHLLNAGTKSSYKSKGSSVSFECLGSVRKSGFLSVKKWLIRKRQSLELARKRGWKGYWVCLKGTTLLFYSCETNLVSTNNSLSNQNLIGSSIDLATGINDGPQSSRTSSSAELTPKHLIFVDSCLVQQVPEHPRRDNVFCLSTSLGDAYLFDATSLPERDHWISVIHTACAAQIARNSGRCSISNFLIEECQRMETFVESDCQSRHEAEIMLTCCDDEKQKQHLINHVLLLDEKIERNRIEIFRLKSYFAALTNDEGPNPKTLLSQASRRTKAQLNRIGVFTVSSLHAFNSAKNFQSLNKTLQRQNSFGSAGINVNDSEVPISFVINQQQQQDSSLIPTISATTSATMSANNPLGSNPNTIATARIVINLILLTGEHRTIEVPNNCTSEQLLSDIFGPGLEFKEYFLRCSETGTILYRNDLLSNYHNQTLIVVPKLLFTIDLVRESNEILFGFSVESELIQNNLRVFVMRVEPNSIAAMHGLCRHDEIMVINGALVQELDMMFVESILQEELTLCLMIRSSRIDVPSNIQSIPNKSQRQQQQSLSLQNAQLGCSSSFDNEKTSSVTDDLIESLVCPPPPSTDFSQLILSDTQLSKYIVPKVDHFLPITDNLQSTTTMMLDDQTSLLMATATDCGHKSSRNSSNKTILLNDCKAKNLDLLSSKDDSDGIQSNLIPLDSLVLSNKIDSLNFDHHQFDSLLLDSNLKQSSNNNCNNNNNNNNECNNQSAIEIDIDPPPPLSSLTTTTTSSSIASNNIAAIKHLEKLLRELLETETNFCQSLQQLVTLYLEPLSQNNFLTQADIKVLFGSILKVIDAQNEFRSELTEVGEHILGDCEFLLAKYEQQQQQQQQQQDNQDSQDNTEPSVNELGVGYIADCFVKHSKNFRDYSTFCASHARAVKLMAQEKTVVHEWLQKQSNGQISQSLESYLIRPIQRVLKYPLLLSQMKALCRKGTNNYNKLEDAIKDLEKVAEHINEMQRIQEEYGAIFEHLARNHTRLSAGPNYGPNVGQNGVIDLSPPALKHYGNVDWINSMEFLGKNCRKGVEWSSICFVFSQCVVFLCKEMIRQRKRMPTAKSIDVEIIRHQVLIPVIEVQVRACPQNDQQSNENDYKWELIQLKMNAGKRSEKIYRLSNKNSDERNDFLRVIRQIIREDVRRMHVNVGQTIPSSSSTMIKTDQEHFVDDTKLSRSKQQHGLPPSLQPPTSSAISKFDSISQKNPRLSMMAKQSSISSRSSNRNENDDQHQNHQHQHQHQHHHHHHHHSHKVPCGFCGKEVSLKHQKQSKDHLIISSPKRNNNWKSSSTSPTNNVINKSHLQQDSSSTTSH